MYRRCVSSSAGRTASSANSGFKCSSAPRCALAVPRVSHACEHFLDRFDSAPEKLFTESRCWEDRTLGGASILTVCPVRGNRSQTCVAPGQWRNAGTLMHDCMGFQNLMRMNTSGKDLELAPVPRAAAWRLALRHPGVELRANCKSIFHGCHLFEVFFKLALTKETIHLLLGCLHDGEVWLLTVDLNLAYRRRFRRSTPLPRRPLQAG